MSHYFSDRNKLTERNTGYIIRSPSEQLSKNHSKEIRHLNSGGGFNGFTPFFFVNRKHQDPKKVEFRDAFLDALASVESRNATSE